MTRTSRTFHLYRYQIVPTVEDFQSDFVTGIESIEELVSRKNEFFADALRSKKEFVHPRADLTHQLYEIGEFFVMKLGANRGLTRITRDFEEEQLENWPSVYIVINNKSSVQLMAVELELQAFYRSSTVVNILEKNLNSRLEQLKLQVQIVPTYEKREFWGIVNANRNKITFAEFFMVAPNLANISKGLQLDLGELKKTTNSTSTNLSMRSPHGEALTLSENDPFTSSLVDYTSRGGGTVHLKIRRCARWSRLTTVCGQLRLTS